MKLTTCEDWQVMVGSCGLAAIGYHYPAMQETVEALKGFEVLHSTVASRGLKKLSQNDEAIAVLRVAKIKVLPEETDLSLLGEGTVLYLNGGNPAVLLSQMPWSRDDLLLFLKRGGRIAGFSAGAMALGVGRGWLSKMAEQPVQPEQLEQLEQPVKPQPNLGILPDCFVPHVAPFSPLRLAKPLIALKEGVGVRSVRFMTDQTILFYA